MNHGDLVYESWPSIYASYDEMRSHGPQAAYLIAVHQNTNQNQILSLAYDER